MHKLLDRQLRKAIGPDGQVRDVDHSAVQYVQRQLGLQVCAIATLSDLLQYLDTPLTSASGELRERVLAYRQRYGVT